MATFKIDDRVIDTTEFIKGTGIVTDITTTPNTGSTRYHVDFKDTNESGWFREVELKEDHECPICSGSGSVVESPDGTTCKEYIQCTHCNGKGEIK